MDIAFAVYPGIVVWRLQMPIWKKVSTIALMSLGLAYVSPFWNANIIRLTIIQFIRYRHRENSCQHKLVWEPRC